MSQAGTSVYGAYEVLVSMGIITYFIPYLFVFASLIRLQREPVAPETMRIPGGRPVATALAALGFVTTLVTIIFSVIPAADEPHKFSPSQKLWASQVCCWQLECFYLRLANRAPESQLRKDSSPESHAGSRRIALSFGGPCRRDCAISRRMQRVALTRAVPTFQADKAEPALRFQESDLRSPTPLPPHPAAQRAMNHPSSRLSEAARTLPFRSIHPTTPPKAPSLLFAVWDRPS